MNPLTQFGLCLLAFGALSGWVVVLRTEYPQVLTRIGVKSPGGCSRRTSTSS